MPPFRMPHHSVDRLRIKRPSFQRILFINRNSTQIHLVRVHDLIDPPRHQPDRLRNPQNIVPNPNQLPISQHREKSLLQGWQAHQRPIQIEKRRDAGLLLLNIHWLHYLLYFPLLHHIAPCAILFTRRTWPTPETNHHPSASTGNPRNKQNAAVIHVSTCAPARTRACASAVIPPSSATGPRVNASSNPR